MLKGVGENWTVKTVKIWFLGVNFSRYFNTDVIISNIYDWIKLLYILQTALPLFNYSNRELFILVFSAWYKATKINVQN